MEGIKLVDLIKDYDYTPETREVNVGTEDEPIKFLVKQRLTMPERISLIDTVVEMIFRNDSYNYDLESVVLDLFTVVYFTNIEIDMSSKEVMFEAYDFITGANVIGAIVEVVGRDYMASICNEVKSAIMFNRQKLVNYTPMNELIIRSLELIGIIKDKLDGMDFSDVLEKVSEEYPEWKDDIVKIIAEHKEEEAE